LTAEAIITRNRIKNYMDLNAMLNMLDVSVSSAGFFFNITADCYNWNVFVTVSLAVELGSDNNG
jgi:hypothetical protein